jgi:hypothetical protein
MTAGSDPYSSYFIVQVDIIDSSVWHVLLLFAVIDEALVREVMFTRSMRAGFYPLTSSAVNKGLDPGLTSAQVRGTTIPWQGLPGACLLRHCWVGLHR